MQWRRVIVVAVGVISAGVLAGVEKQPDNLHMSMLRGECESAMPALGIGRCEQSHGVCNQSQSSRGGKVQGVLTDQGIIAADLVFIANGLWMADLLRRTVGDGPLPALPFTAGRGWLTQLGKLDFELRARMCEGSNPGNDVAWHQAEDKSVRVVKNDRVVDCQIKLYAGRRGRSYRTRNLRCLHRPRVPAASSTQ